MSYGEDEKHFGFRDSIDWKTGTTAKHHLTPSHGMAFLTLANVLHDGIVWRSFQQDPLVEQGLKKLGLDTHRIPEIEKAILSIEKR